MASFPQASPPTLCAPLYPPPYVPHALPISFISILPPAQYWVRSIQHIPYLNRHVGNGPHINLMLNIQGYMGTQCITFKGCTNWPGSRPTLGEETIYLIIIHCYGHYCHWLQKIYEFLWCIWQFIYFNTM